MKWQRDCGLCVGLVVVVGMLLAPSAFGEVALGTAFTYQGQLKKDGAPVNGQCDFQFSLHDAATGGAQVGLTQTVLGRNVTNGLFTVALDFGQGAFDGNARWLEIHVRLPGGADWSSLSPRQPLTPTPYALVAVKAAGLTMPSGAEDGYALTCDAAGVGAWSDLDLRYYRKEELNTSDGSAPNSGSNRVSWNNLTDVPIGFTDGVDNHLMIPLVSTWPTNYPDAVISGTTTGTGFGVYGEHRATGSCGYLGCDEYGVFGWAADDQGVCGESVTGTGVSGGSNSGAGVWGESVSGTGVWARSDSGNAIMARTYSDAAVAVDAKNEASSTVGELGGSDFGVRGADLPSGNRGYLGTAAAGVDAYGSGVAVHGTSAGYAGLFDGQVRCTSLLDVDNLEVRGGANVGTDLDVTGDVSLDGLEVRGGADIGGDLDVTGNVSKGSGSFKIDHPLDPASKYLYHSFVESPDMMNVYNGNVRLDANGRAWVELPKWFEALNRDFRYQLTCIGGFAQVYIADEIRDNRFQIAGGRPGLKVSWQVSGIRQDPYANAHRIIVEQDKAPEERGYYLHPKAHGQPEERGMEHLRGARHRLAAHAMDKGAQR